MSLSPSAVSGSHPVLALVLAVVLLVAACPAFSQPQQPLTVSVLTPTAGAVVGVNGTGWLFDVAVTASDAAGNALLNSHAYAVQFNNWLNTSVPTQFNFTNSGVGPGANRAGQGLVVLFSTTPVDAASALMGANTNLAGLFNLNALSSSSGGMRQFHSTVAVLNTVFGVGVPITATVFVVNGIAPALFPAVPTSVSGIVSNILTLDFSTSSLVSVTAATEAYTRATPALPDAISVAVFYPSSGDVLATNAIGIFVDLSLTCTAPQFNPLLSAAAGYRALLDNETNPAVARPGFNVAAPGLVVLFNTTGKLAGTPLQGPTTNIAGLFILVGLLQLNTTVGSSTLWGPRGRA